MTRIIVAESLSFGALPLCAAAPAGVAVVHACKDPCHRRAASYRQGSLTLAHPAYLAVERDHHLYLNLIDPPVPLFKLESFARFFAFMDREIAARPVFIHCNKGESRAPSLALLYMAKRLGLLPDDSYAAARIAFTARHPYKPGRGIAHFLDENWQILGREA